MKQANKILFFLFAFVAALIYESKFLVPLMFAVFLAGLVTPVASKFESWGTSTALSSIISSLMVFGFILILTYLFVDQLAIFAQDFPRLQSELDRLRLELQVFVEKSFGITTDEQLEMIRDRSEEIRNAIQVFAQASASLTMAMILQFFLVLIYCFLFLLHREKFKSFILMYVPDEKKDEALDIIQKSSRVESSRTTIPLG
ncbi:MAG: AI-2E family transporter [Oligoflexus sp.]